MTVDPTDPDTFVPEGVEAAESSSPETPEADSAEQHADLAPQEDDPVQDADRDTASEADLAEQARVVALDEDDYR